MSGSGPIVSVVISTFNRRPKLERALKSVLGQTLEQIEIIIVDNASTDNTKEFVESLKDRRIRYIRHDTNKGGPAARNTGINAAKAGLIALLDDDDEWFPSKLAKQVEKFKDSPSNTGLIYAGAEIYDEALQKITQVNPPRFRGNVYERLLLGTILSSCTSVLVKAECFEKAGLFDEKLTSCQDWDMWLRIARYFEFDYIDETLVRINMHGEQISTDYTKLIPGRTRMVEKHAEEFKKYPDIYVIHLKRIGKLHGLNGTWNEARNWFKKAIDVRMTELLKIIAWLLFELPFLKLFSPSKFFKKYRPLKVLLVGHHNPNFVNTIVYRERAVENLGHQLITFDDRHFLIPGRIRSKISFLQQWDLKRLNTGLGSFVQKKRPDVCFIIGGHRVLPATVRQIKKAGIQVVLWTTDVPIDFRNILETAPFYDHLFCAGSEARDIFLNAGFKNITLVSFGCDPNYHKQISLSEAEKKRYGHDVVFVGSYYPNRARILEPLADQDIGVWGPYWQQLPQQSPLKEKAVNIKMNYDRWVKIYNASKINIVVHYQEAQVPCHQASPKLFEAMACGSFVLCDRQKDAMALFKDQHHLVFFDDEKDLREKVNYYLQHEEERQRIARQGHQEVLAKHTYQDRFRQMLGILHKG